MSCVFNSAGSRIQLIWTAVQPGTFLLSCLVELHRAPGHSPLSSLESLPFLSS